MDIRPILLLTALITFVLAEEPPSGNVLSDDTTYQETREKRNFAQLDPEELLKRAPMGFQGMRGKKNSLAGYGNEIFLEDANKRAPVGFQGMRGKKNKAITNFEDLYSMDDYEKRAPMGFQGMRGKKLSLADMYYKRAPMGFQGMRGKKSFEQILDETRKRRFQDPEKDVYLFDYPDYGKRTLPVDGYENILDRKDEWEIGKAPLVFQGTKGKDMILDTLGEVDKRDVIDFRGMQGKKDTLDNYVDYSNPFDYKKSVTNFQNAEGDSESLKRGQMGFHGMRGKRDAAGIYGSSSSTARTTMDYPDISTLEGNSLATFEIEKRSPIRYLGFRGKKNPRWEFRGKFIGVRGKKSSNSQTIGHRQAVFY